jgi:hypothetical protein
MFNETLQRSKKGREASISLKGGMAELFRRGTCEHLKRSAMTGP